MGLGYAGFLDDNCDLKIPCPVLLILGEKDKTGKVAQYNKEWARQTGYPLEIINDAAHNVNVDKPDEVNALIHPAVKDKVRERTAKAKEEGKVDFVFIEAALLIEAGYLPELDELWYVCAGESLRAKRLMEARGYSTERIEGIMEQQLTEEEFRKYAHRVIVNDGTIEELKEQIDKIMGDYLWQE